MFMPVTMCEKLSIWKYMVGRPMMAVRSSLLTRQMSAVVASIWQAIPGPRRCVSVRPVSPRCLNG